MLLAIFNSFSWNAMSTEDIWSTWWLVIRLSPSIEPSKLLMTFITFWFKQLQVSKLILVINGESEIHVWHDVLLLVGLLLKRPRKGGIQFSAFTHEFGHDSEEAFPMCGSPKKVISRDNSLQLTFHLLA